MKRIVRQVTNIKPSPFYSATGNSGSLSQFFSTSNNVVRAQAEKEETSTTSDAAPQEEETTAAESVPTQQATSESPAKQHQYLTLTKNSQYFPKEHLQQRQFNGYIQPEHYKKSESQLASEFTKEMEKIAAPIFAIEPPVIDLEMGTNKLKFQILKEATRHFGREVPLKDIATLRTVKDVVNFFVKQVLSEIPPPQFNVPKNVSLFIKSHAKKREILVRERMVQLISDRKRKAVERQFKRYFPGPTPQLTDEEVEYYLKVFRRNADDKVFKKKLFKKFNPRKLHDTRISYERPFTSESEDVFSRKYEKEEQQV